MRIHRKTLTLIIASLCGTGATAVAQDDFRFDSRSRAGRIGDSDVAGSSQSNSDDSLSQDTSLKGDSGRISDDSDLDPSRDLPGQVSSISDDSNEFDNEDPNPYALPVGYHSSNNYGTQGSDYSTVACSPSATLSSARSGLGWMEFDSLFWWGRGLTNSPVIVGGASQSVLPTNPIAGGQDNPVGTDMLFGLRGDLGVWLDDCQHYGVGGRVWGILSDAQEQIYTNGGNSTGISFFNTSLGQPDTYVVNLDTNGFGANTGTIGVLNELDVISGELYGRALLIGDTRNRTDLIGGYTFLRLDSAYRLQSIVTDGVTNAPPPVGTVTTLTDQFTTHNEFHGGHIGLSSNLTRGRVGFELKGKVSMGNMQSTSIVSGAFSQVPPLPNVPVSENRGLFAQSSNIGTISRDAFTFIPEANARLRYRLGRAQLGIGYSLVVLPNVAMAAGQIDNNIDAFAILNTPVAPSPKFNTEAIYLQGLDLGLTFNF